MLDLQQLRPHLNEFANYHAEHRESRKERLERAVEVLTGFEGDVEAIRMLIRQAEESFLVAGVRERPAARRSTPSRPTPLTVVASDGSQIYPDRHLEPACYVLNISRIAFHYGTTEAPVLDAVPFFRYRHDEWEDPVHQYIEAATAEVVSALRDEEELAQLLATASEQRVEGRPVLAVSDGTLIRWMLRGMRNRALEQELIGRYTRLLAQFQARAVPLCSYISMPGNTEVVHLAHVLSGEALEIEGLVDRQLFDLLLAPGERSAMFESASHIQREYGAQDRICYFYLKTCAEGLSGAHLAPEVARVEMPQWVAEDPELLELVHATILSECRKGGGYPMILSEAHERAVIRSAEKDAFRTFLEQSLRRQNLQVNRSRKAVSKRRPSV